MRYDFEESVVARYNGDTRAAVNQSFEYIGKNVPLLKCTIARVYRWYPCEHLSSITSTHPFLSSTPS